MAIVQLFGAASSGEPHISPSAVEQCVRLYPDPRSKESFSKLLSHHVVKLPSSTKLASGSKNVILSFEFCFNNSHGFMLDSSSYVGNICTNDLEMHIL